MTKDKLKIGTAAKQLGVTPQTLRYWESQGVIQSERSEAGQRYFDKDQVQKLSLVKIGQAAKLLGVHRDTLRRMEQRGDITPKRSEGGTRLYDLGQLLDLQQYGTTADMIGEIRLLLAKATALLDKITASEG
jgi:excisionase family DNA binding protein